MPNKKKSQSLNNNTQKEAKVSKKSGFNNLVDRKFNNQSKTSKQRDLMIKDYQNRHSANTVQIKKKANRDVLRNKNQFQGKRDKRNIFEDLDDGNNNNDDLQLLTHKGVAIDDLEDEQLKRSIASDEEVDEIDQEMLESLRFQGFDDEENAKGGNEADPQKKKKTRKEIYEEVIKKSKKAKHERQEFKEDYFQSVKELDENINDIFNIVGVSKKVKTEDPEDDYAMMAMKLSGERIIAPGKIAKKIDEKEQNRKRKIVNQLYSDSDEEQDPEAGVDGLKDGLGKERKFRDVLNAKKQKDSQKMGKTIDFLKGLNEGSGDSDEEDEEEELSELDLDDDEQEMDESASEDYVDYENLEEAEIDEDDEEGEEEEDDEGEEEEDDD